MYTEQKVEVRADDLPYRLVSRRPVITMPASEESVQRKHADLDALRARLAQAESDIQDELNNAAAGGDTPSCSTTATVKINPMLSLFIHTP